MKDARDVIGKTIFVQRGIARHGSWEDYKAWAQRQKIEPDFLVDADAILSALSAMPLASRHALTRALVPGWTVVPVEPTVAMLQDGDMAIRHARPGGVSGMTIEAQTKAECARAGACWAAMLTAAEEPPHGP